MKKFLGGVIIFSFVSIATGLISYAALKYESPNYNNESKVLGLFIQHTLKECNEKLGAYGEDANFELISSDMTISNLSDCLKKLNKHEKVVSAIPFE